MMSTNDEFADFETWDRGSFGAAKDPDMIPREYAREALKSDLAFEEELGANPFKFGMIGSTDSHTSLATTGTRILVRVFAGWDFLPLDLDRADFAAHGCANGIPMGGDLSSAGQSAVPKLLIRVVRDPDGANLDRVQVVKGWLDGDGNTHERIYDVAVSGGRAIDADGRARQPVGNTVDVIEATYTNSIGSPFLAAYWSDPDFNPDERAFYYVRALEIPTPRWTTIDAKVFGVELPDGVPASIQERAYTTPIWYTP